MKAQSGFTLVELLVVIIILGVLSATALPKFMDLSTDAESAMTGSVADNITAWGQANFAACKLGKTSCRALTTTDVCTTTTAGGFADATTLGAVFSGGDVTLVNSATTPSTTTQYKVTGQNTGTSADDDCAKDKTVTCTIAHKNNLTVLTRFYLACTN